MSNQEALNEIMISCVMVLSNRIKFEKAINIAMEQKHNFCHACGQALDWEDQDFRDYREKGTEMEELKQCPFCGNRAYLFTTDELGYSEKDRYTVKCGSCFCGTGQYADQERAKEAWNRRTVPSQN